MCGRHAGSRRSPGRCRSHAAAVWARSVAPRARIAARGNSVSEVMEAMKSGVGVAPLPIPYAKREDDLVMVLDSRPELNVPFYVVIHRDMQRVRAFLDFLAAERKLVRRALEVGIERRKA
jgi:DNA-binding transcriptional LysR family regulator